MMFDETNQAELNSNIEEENFDENSFLGETDFEEEEVSGDEVIDNSPTTASETENEEGYTVKYNGKEIKLSLDELKTNAQKGLNYDHIKGEMEDMKNTSVFKTLSDMAKKEGVSFSEYVRRLDDYRSEKRFDELTGKGLDKESAERFIELEKEISRRDDEARRERPYVEFASRFPNVNASDIKDEVWDRFNETGDLVSAYIEYENKELKEKLQILSKEEENKKAKIGSLKSSGASYDAFLDGLLTN